MNALNQKIDQTVECKEIADFAKTNDADFKNFPSEPTFEKEKNFVDSVLVFIRSDVGITIVVLASVTTTLMIVIFVLATILIKKGKKVEKEQGDEKKETEVDIEMRKVEESSKEGENKYDIFEEKRAPLAEPETERISPVGEE